MAGAMSRAIRRRPGSRGAHSGRKRHPRRRSEGTCTRNWARPPSSVPRAQPITTCSRGSPRAQRTPAHTIATRLKSAGERAGMPNRSSALSIPIATAAKETSSRNGIMTRVRKTVRAAFPGSSSKPGARADTSGQAKTIAVDDQAPEEHREHRQDAVGEGERRLAAALLLRARVGRDERGGERPLREEVAQEVRDPEADPEGVRVVAGPDEGGEDDLADEAEHPRDEGHGRHEPRRAGDPGLLRPRLDLGARAH